MADRSDWVIAFLQLGGLIALAVLLWWFSG